MDKHRADRRTLKAASVGTGIAAATALSIAAVSGFGSHESNRHEVPPSSIGTLATPWADIPAAPTEGPAATTDTQATNVTPATGSPIAPSGAALKPQMQSETPAVVLATTNPANETQVIAPTPATPTEIEALPTNTEGEAVAEESTPGVTPEAPAVEEEAPIVVSPAPSDPCEAGAYCGYDVNVPELTNSSVGPAAVVGDAYGLIPYNYGTIVNNYGEVGFNFGTVVNNYGTVHWNSQGPYSYSGAETIVNNYGTVHHNGSLNGPGGTIENNYGEVVGTQGNIVNDYAEEAN